MAEPAPSPPADRRNLVDRILDRIKNNRLAAALIVLCIGIAALASLSESARKLYQLLPGPAPVVIDGRWQTEPFQTYGSSGPETVILRLKEINGARLTGFVRFLDEQGKPNSPEFDIIKGKHEGQRITVSFETGLKHRATGDAPLLPVAQSMSGDMLGDDLQLVYERDGYAPIPLAAHKVRVVGLPKTRSPAMPALDSLADAPLLASQWIVRICLFLVAFIACAGGALQFMLGQPDTSPRLDNVHRFMAGVYFSTGLINLWAAITIRQQGTLVYLLALGILLAGIGRLVSIAKVGLPQPRAVWLGYLIPELLLPFVIAGAHYMRAAA